MASRGLANTLGLPNDATLRERFEQAVRERIRTLPDGAVIVDVGGGRDCFYHDALRPGIELIITDISPDELSRNPHATRTLVSDIAQSLPLPFASVDLLISRTVLEHVPDVRAAARHMAGALKPGGETLHYVPGRYSLFGMAARWLPFEPLLGLLHWLLPETQDAVEFDVCYDQGTPRQLGRAFESADFRDVTVEITWAQPGYFEPIFPLYLIYALYEFVVRTLRLRTLAAYSFLRATR